ncbi:CMP/dCMP deaminase, zinc-binding protein [Thioalkalivibrio nitratireducens DSM 14787]|uniref:CMP/dCMP deaminase, zinc-binding protein n=1 Tax=Thioalkalivibrio nitratireducens (strain DSM 14787 / UNIQEM 213 / ALEN2) TaxID=1255043 RepID=L0DYD5_THIND|nr:nucleoside deaminase [Thioalkalivibrio nitratireducens]AGA34614.1 CMP/dCMP deaminase, zinc-binding protein [Thioalkalivibrio nitratireducens DSM 14787]
MNSRDTHTTLHLPQPGWLPGWLAQPPPAPDDRARMTEVVAIARENVERGSGGPFAAAVYRLDGTQRISAAVNTTIASHCAAAHAELQALALAQQRLGRHTLEPLPCVLFSSSAPCTMCLGAIAWSGVRRFVFATDRCDVEAVGFDEGPPTPRWRAELARRGIEVRGPLLRADGLVVLRRYVERGGPIYNGQPG